MCLLLRGIDNGSAAPAIPSRSIPRLIDGCRAYRRDPELLKEHSRHIRPPRGRGYLYQLLAAWGWTSLPWLGALRQATLVMHGSDDPIVPLANAKILAACIRNASLYVVDDGHLFLVTRAHEMAAVVKDFLRHGIRRAR